MPQQGGLAGPVGAGNHDESPLADAEIDPIEPQLGRLEPVDQVFDHDNVRAHGEFGLVGRRKHRGPG